MIDSVPALAALQARISTIRAHAGLESPGARTAPAPTARGFEPFGEAYQRALATAPAAPTAPDVADVGLAAVPTVEALLRSASPGWSGSPAAGGLLGIGSVGSIGSGGIGGVPPAGTTGASVGQIGGYGPLRPPDELAGFGNGRVPAEALAPIGQGGHRLHGPAATAWRAAVAAAAADGIDLRITDSYRDYDQQVDLAARKGLYRDGGLAAVPGTSNHGWGLAVDADVTDPATLAWLRANAHRFGFVEAVPREPWHWEYRPEQA